MLRRLRCVQIFLKLYTITVCVICARTTVLYCEKESYILVGPCDQKEELVTETAWRTTCPVPADSRQ